MTDAQNSGAIPDGCPACGALPIDWAGGANPHAFCATPAPSDQAGLAEQIALGLAAIDVEVNACPANKQFLGDRPCPKCRAERDEGCRREGVATNRFVQDMRAALSTLTAGEGGGS